jgi:hypothetical protein
MLEWLKKSFECLFVVCAWVIILLLAILGAIIGYDSAPDRWGLPIAIIGIVIGVIIAVGFLGLVAIFILQAKKVDEISVCQEAICRKIEKLSASSERVAQTSAAETPLAVTEKSPVVEKAKPEPIKEETEEERKKRFDNFEF